MSLEPSNSRHYEFHAATINNPEVIKLLNSLKHWLNSFNTRSVAVTDIFNDLSIAYIVATLIKRQSRDKIIELDASNLEATPKNYAFIMGVVVQYCEKELGIHQEEDRWTLQGILERNISSLLCFLVELAMHFRCQFEIPNDVSVAIVCKDVAVNFNIDCQPRHAEQDHNP